jgi:hypothetical protein
MGLLVTANKERAARPVVKPCGPLQYWIRSQPIGCRKRCPLSPPGFLKSRPKNGIVKALILTIIRVSNDRLPA